MSSGKSRFVFATLLVGLVLLQAYTFSPQKETRVVLAPDALARAVATHNQRLLELCLADGVDVNAPGSDGRTPLLVALDGGNRAIIPRLLALGASVDVPDRGGRTPLMTVAAAGELDLLRQFLERSSRPDARDAQGRSAAHHAAAARHLAALEILLPLTPEATEPNTGGNELLGLAYDSGDLKMIETVLARYPKGGEWTSITRRTLTAALISKNDALVRLLLSKHLGPPTAEGTDIPLLAQAVVAGDLATLKALLAAGADPNVTLTLPVPKEFASAVTSSYLRDYVRSDEGVTPLMLAAGMGRLEYLRALLEAGANRNLQTKRHKMLALYFAARAKKSECVQALLGRGPRREELRIEISLATQRAAVIKNGVPILKTSVSTGRKGFDTPPGEYVVTDKRRNHRSSVYHVEMPFFMRLNCLDFGMHAGAVPNYPASHGCIRLPAAVAERIFAEVPVGTVVSIN